MMRRFRHAIGDGHMAGVEFGDPAKDYGAVFLHANGFNAMTYQSILAPLGVRARVAGVDLRGHGVSELPTNPKALKGWQLFRDDVISFLEKQTPKGTVLAGHSMGATVSLLVAAARPDLVRGLILADPVILGPGTYRNQFIIPGAVTATKSSLNVAREARKRRSTFESPEEALEHFSGRGAFATWREPFLSDYVHDGLIKGDDGLWHLACAPEWEAAIFGAQRHRPWQALKRTKCQTVILRGAQKSTISEAVAARILKVRPLTVIEKVRGTTHFLPMEAPYALRDQLSEFISRHIEGFEPGEEGRVKRTLMGNE